MNFLQTYGWNEFHQTSWDNLIKSNPENQWKVGRVTTEHRHMYTVMTEEGEWLSVCSGTMLHDAATRQDYPAVGDWIAVTQMPGENRGVIHAILPRTSIFSRKTAGNAITEQLIAVNVDIVFLVTSMNEDFNERRLERYLTAAYESGAVPIIVLTKLDLCDSPDEYTVQAKSIAAGASVFRVSSRTGEGLAALKNLIKDGKTAALLGSSGVGKSSLVNAFCGSSVMDVHDIRRDDAKGRHTTTHRELIALPEGGILIDTPGMREFQIWNDTDSVENSFTDIEELAALCKFNDCTHSNEPECRIQLALSEGMLAKERYENYIKLQKEAAYLERKTNLQAQLAERARWKKMTKSKRR